MIIYRLANTQFKDDFKGEGAALFGGRWNSVGMPMFYASSHISLAVLELLVNKRTSAYFNISFHLIEMQIPNNAILEISSQALKNKWQHDMEYTQFIGDQFLQESQKWILQVPSAVIEEEHNYLVNPNHPNMTKMKINSSRSYKLDTRLIT